MVSVTPPIGAVGLCPNTIVTATFSEAMNPASIDTTTFTLTGPGTNPVTGLVTYDALSDTAIFTPSSGLALSTTFTATITTGVQDLLGNTLTANFVWTFTTGATSCQAPLPPNSVTPPLGSAGICPSTVVAATFPQAMNPATINTTTFTLMGPGLTAVAGTITHDVTNKIFTFTPSSSLAPEHALHRDHYDRSPGRIWQCAGEQLSMDLHHRCRVVRSPTAADGNFRNSS